MKQIKHQTTDFLMTFFVGNRMLSKTMSEILKNRQNPLFYEDMGLPKGMILPFFQEELSSSMVYCLRQSAREMYRIYINDKLCTEHLLENGDYLVFQDEAGCLMFKILCISISEIRLAYKKYQLKQDVILYIGRDESNDISFDFTDYVSRKKHIAIRLDSEGNAYVEDLKRREGVYVNGLLTHSKQLQLFDEICLMGLSMIYLGDALAVRDLHMTSTLLPVQDKTLKEPVPEKREDRYFITTPRISRTLDNDEVEIDGPPQPPSSDKTPLLLTIGPSLTMALVMLVSLSVSIVGALNGSSTTSVITSSAMTVGMLLGSLLWPMLLRNYQKKRLAEEQEYRTQRYTAYIQEQDELLAAKMERSSRLLDQVLNPAPAFLCELLDNEVNRLRLWERSYSDDDFLSVRMGTGKRPFDVSLKIPKSGFRLYPDELSDLPAKLAQKYSVLPSAPLTLDMKNNRTIGLIGDQQNMDQILNEILLNVVSLHPYDEVKLVMILSSRQAERFAIYKNLPHIWSSDKKIRYFATTPDEVHIVCNSIDEIVQERVTRESSSEKISAVPHYFFVVMKEGLVEKETLFRYMNDPDNKVGITALFAYGDITQMPRSCRTIIQSDNSRTGYYIRNENQNRFTPFTPDSVNPEKLRNFAAGLSRLPIRYDLRAMGIIDRISFLQMYRAGNVSELEIETHWDNNNSAKSLAVPVGVIAGGEVFNLDIHEAYHGCHGLVAGTSGSGKSEFLQAFVLSLAINFSPKEVAFVLVDFKGGDMARPFMAKKNAPALPHLAATISNLSGNILHRALVSLEAEIKSRQNIFNESAAALGVDKLDINSYHKYYKSGRLTQALPHLVIIIDEFAQLKTQQPEFLTQLINVAQVGRSLGIHLILATQKPGGIVDPQIMSNSRFKICLRVADKQDSVDVINKSDAALIKNPGRLYLQVGYDEIYECIQSGYSGAEYAPTETYHPDAEVTVQMTDQTATPIHTARLDLAEHTDKTQLEAVVAQMIQLGQKKHLAAKPLWLDVLPETILLQDLPMESKGLASAVIGLADLVRTQRQKPLCIDFARSGHIALYGASGSGKTTFLQTMVYSMVQGYGYTPEQLNLYVLDFGGRSLGYMDLLPHTGGVIYADEAEKLAELASVLTEIMDERKRLFAANHCGTFTDYRALGRDMLPAILVLIDNYASFRDKYMDLSDTFAQMIGAASTFGIYFVLTGTTKNAIHYKAAEYVATRFALKMNDPGSYMDILNRRPPVLPESIAGRGITVVDGEVVEFQTAIPQNEEMEAARIEAICTVYRQIAAQWKGALPVGIGRVGEEETSSVSHTSAPELLRPDPCEDDADHLLLGSSRSGALQYGIDLREERNLCICASGTADLSTAFDRLMRSAAAYPERRFVLIEDGRGTLEAGAQHCPNCRRIQNSEQLDQFIEQIKQELNDRLADEQAREKRMLLIIAEFNTFFEGISDEQAAFLRKVLRYIDSAKYGITFICGFDVDGDKSNDSLFMNLVVRAGNYLFCPDSSARAEEKVESLPRIPELKAGSAYLCLQGKETEIRW